MATITTLIPAYKKDYLGELFLGLARQNFRDFRVVLSDDSPGEEISALIRSGHFGALLKGLDLTLLVGPKHARLNHVALIRHWNHSSPYVHIHLDDDLIYPDFYRQHLEAHATGRFSASISRRWITHMDSRPVHGIEQPRFVAQSPLRVVPVDGDALFSSMVPTCNNWLGEFSNMLLSAEGLSHWPVASATEMNYYGWPDVGFLLTAGQHLPVAVLRDHLGVFRQHPGQTTHQARHHGGRVSFMAWAAYALQAWKEGRITHPQAVHAISYTVGECLKRFAEDDAIANRFYDLIQHQGHSMEGLYAAFKPFWLELLASHPATAPEAVFAPRAAATSAPAATEATPA